MEVHRGSRQWSRKELIGKRILNFKLTVIRELDYKE